MAKEPKKAVSVLLPLNRYQRLKDLASQTGYTLPGYIRQVLRVHLRYLDQYPDHNIDFQKIP